MHKKETVSLQGIYTQGGYGGIDVMQCSISAIDFADMYSAPEDLANTDSFFSSISRPFNVKPIEEAAEYIVNAVFHGKPSPVLNIVVALEGDVSIEREERSELSSITFRPENAYVVDGVQSLIAINGLLGTNNPFSKDFEINKLVLNEIKEKIKSIFFPVSIIFSTETPFTKENLIYLFKEYNSHDTRIHSTQLAIQQKDHPLLRSFERIAEGINIDKFGGISYSSRKTKNDSYITTQAAMLSLILAAIGGKSARLSKSLPEKLPNNLIITDDLVKSKESAIISFMSIWLEASKKQFKHNPNGFHQSTQLWQALGLVIHQLLKEFSPDSDVFAEKALILGKLDFDRTAAHWSQCDALKLDASGKYYINATQGGRTLRDGFAKYFNSLI